MEPLELAGFVERKGLEMGGEDVSALATRTVERMVRFSNNSITLASAVKTVSIQVYLGLGKRRIVGNTVNPNPQDVEAFVRNLKTGCEALAPSEDYAKLPEGPFKYPANPEYDKELVERGADLTSFVKVAIDSATSAGASRVAGILKATSRSMAVKTSGKAESFSTTTSVVINVRAFADEGSSGYGLSCTPSLKALDAEAAGRTAGEQAVQSKNPSSVEAGVYDVVFTPIVAADLIQLVGHFSSAFAVQMGASFLASKLGQKVAAEDLTISEAGCLNEGPGGRIFDDEGYPAQPKEMISKGVLKTYLHNSTTAKSFNVSPTGNAGLIDPHPWLLAVEPGRATLDELIKSVKLGLLVTNNWYTRFQNIRTADYSTLPRDANFLIRDGEVKQAVKGFRLGGSLPDQLLAVKGLGRERKWVRSWEVEIPTLTPPMLVAEVQVSKAQS